MCADRGMNGGGYGRTSRHGPCSFQGEFASVRVGDKRVVLEDHDHVLVHVGPCRVRAVPLAVLPPSPPKVVPHVDVCENRPPGRVEDGLLAFECGLPARLALHRRQVSEFNPLILGFVGEQALGEVLAVLVLQLPTFAIHVVSHHHTRVVARRQRLALHNAWGANHRREERRGKTTRHIPWLLMVLRVVACCSFRFGAVRSCDDLLLQLCCCCAATVALLLCCCCCAAAVALLLCCCCCAAAVVLLVVLLLLPPAPAQRRGLYIYLF